MRNISLLIVTVSVLACSSSPGISNVPRVEPPIHGPIVQPSLPKPPSWGDALRQQDLADTMVDFIQGRDVPKNFSSLAQGPELALGSIYIVKARPGKTCQSSSADDFEEARLPDFRKRDSSCDTKIHEKLQRQDQTVKGSVHGSLEVVVGKGNVNAEHMYQLTFEDTSTVLVSPRDCIDLDALMKSTLPARTCSAKYIVGAVLTTVTWREFQKADLAANAAYLSLIKVGIDMFGSSSNTTITPVLSFDGIDLESFAIVSTENGYLQIVNTDKKPPVIKDALFKDALGKLGKQIDLKKLSVEKDK